MTGDRLSCVYFKEPEGAGFRLRAFFVWLIAKEGAADIWWQFRRGGSRILPGRVRRRTAEKALFLSD